MACPKGYVKIEMHLEIDPWEVEFDKGYLLGELDDMIIIQSSVSRVLSGRSEANSVSSCVSREFIQNAGDAPRLLRHCP